MHICTFSFHIKMRSKEFEKVVREDAGPSAPTKEHVDIQCARSVCTHSHRHTHNLNRIAHNSAPNYLIFSFNLIFRDCVIRITAESVHLQPKSDFFFHMEQSTRRCAAACERVMHTSPVHSTPMSIDKHTSIFWHLPAWKLRVHITRQRQWSDLWPKKRAQNVYLHLIAVPCNHHMKIHRKTFPVFHYS